MKRYFKVTFRYSESIFCVNIAHAESHDAVPVHYERYDDVWIEDDIPPYELESAKRKGMPIVEC